MSTLTNLQIPKRVQKNLEDSGMTGSGREIPICADTVIQSGPKWSMMDLQCWCSKNGKIAMRENKSTNKCHWRSKVRKNSKKKLQFKEVQKAKFKSLLNFVDHKEGWRSQNDEKSLQQNIKKSLVQLALNPFLLWTYETPKMGFLWHNVTTHSNLIRGVSWNCKNSFIKRKQTHLYISDLNGRW